MARKLVIFGIGEVGELAHYYFSHGDEYRPVAFTVDAAYLNSASFQGLPVIAFEELSARFAPQDHELFVAIGYARLNRAREERYRSAKALGYRLATYVSPRATVLNEGRIGDNCFILEDNTIQPFATIGNDVTLWSGNHVGHHSSIGDHCFVTSHVVISGGVRIGERTFLGVNATLRDHISVGAGCVIGAGSLILKDVADDSVYSTPGAELARVPASRLRKL